MGLHLTSCGAGVSLARSVISDGAVVPSHPGRCADGLMCGEMSRKQSFSLSTNPPPLSVVLFTSVCPFIVSTFQYLPVLSIFTPSRLLISPLFHPSPPVATASWGLGLGRRPQQNKLAEMQGRISGLCYRKICPFALCRAARRANGGCVMERHGALAFVLVESFIPVAENTPVLPEYRHTELPSLSK